MKINQVDTREEQKRLNYNPDFKYQPDRKVTVERTLEDNIEEQVGSNEDLFKDEYKPEEQYEEFLELNQLIDKLTGDIEEKYKDTVFVLSNLDILRLESLGYKVENGQLTFQEYKDTFEEWSNTNELIQDIVQNHVSSLTGELALEVYEDLMEMKEFLQENFYLYKEASLSRIFAGDAVMPVSAEDPSFINEIKKAKEAELGRRKIIIDAIRDIEPKYYEALKEDYGSDAFFANHNTYLKETRKEKQMMRKEKQLLEVSQIIDTGNYGIRQNVYAIEDQIALTSTPEKERVINFVNAQESNADKLANLLSTALTFNVDHKNEEKMNLRHTIRKTNSLDALKALHEDLINTVELREALYLQLFDEMPNLNGLIREDAVTDLLNQVSDGLRIIKREYQELTL
ncbi:MAG: hypothetical protein ACRC5C_11495, partial [Bacilli bacterium]